jgi:hypothetical protein
MTPSSHNPCGTFPYPTCLSLRQAVIANLRCFPQVWQSRLSSDAAIWDTMQER